jgi:hypothetical protein
VQEIVWEHLEALRRRERTFPAALRALAERLQLLEASG